MFWSGLATNVANGRSWAAAAFSAATEMSPDFRWPWRMRRIWLGRIRSCAKDAAGRTPSSSCSGGRSVDTLVLDPVAFDNGAAVSGTGS